MHTDNSPRAAVGSAGIAIYMAVFRILHNRIKKNSKNPILLLTSEIIACIIILTDSTGGDKKGKAKKTWKKMKKALTSVRWFGILIKLCGCTAEAPWKLNNKTNKDSENSFEFLKKLFKVRRAGRTLIWILEGGDAWEDVYNIFREFDPGSG